MNKSGTIPPKDLPRVVWRRVLREYRARTAPVEPRAVSVDVNIRELAGRLRERRTPRFFGLIPEQTTLIARFFPEACQQTIREADEIRAHHFDLLGSGEVILGDSIDWHTDFKSGHTWPPDHHTKLNLTAPQGGFDVKVPWELSRFHHAIRLGQAYQFTLDDIYAQEIVLQIEDWIERNPCEFGVNWAGPMDVAIRAVNWLWACYLIIESPELTLDFLSKWLASLREHGNYLLKHLEDGWPRTNHLIANLTGLAYLGILFPEFREASRWRSVGLDRLWEELARQVNPDGLDYEASLSYHRLVTEMGLSVAALCVVNDIEVPQTVKDRLAAMLDAIMVYTQPDGTAPQIGDADDGRLHPLSVYPDRDRAMQDHRHLLALGSLVLERTLSEWAGFVDPSQRGWAIAAGDTWQDAFWCFASDAAARYTDTLTLTSPQPQGAAPDDWVPLTPDIRVRARALLEKPLTLSKVAASRGFKDSGLYVMRHSSSHMTIRAGNVGQAGAGGHAHNDTFSVTLCSHGHTFLIDPGSYLYTANPQARNVFRATAAHNTLQINREEINPLPDSLFLLREEARVTVHRWESTPAYDLFDASHTGYERLKPGVIHRRQVFFDKHNELWLIRDLLTPAHAEAGEVGIALFFHFAPVPLQINETHKAITTHQAGANLALLPLGDFPLTPVITRGWYAPRYGIRRESPVAKFTGHVKLPAELNMICIGVQGAPSLPEAGRAGLRILDILK